MRKLATHLRQIHDSLVNSWDPLGVHYHPRGENEYECFAEAIYDLLHERRSETALFAYLRWAAERMGVPGPEEVLRPLVAELLRIEFKPDASGERGVKVTYLRTPRQAA